MARSKAMRWILAVALVVVLPGMARAARGFYLGAGMGAAVPGFGGDVTDISPDSGLNAELIHLGYNFTDQWGIGLQWGAAAGTADDFLGDDTVWSQGYYTLSGRYSFDQGQQFVPYIEAGFGDYVFMITGDGGDFASDPELGCRIAVGGQFYLGRFYLSPEISYHVVSYDQGEFDLAKPLFQGYPKNFDSDFHTRGDVLIIQLKVGYHWRQTR
ncbi:MAG TPA: outer membrane beta-barrel protein [bacterium]|nr:outer membrane beta-barrel protein [bacterium]